MSVTRTLKHRYEIRETIGTGGMGVIYAAYDFVAKRDVALKTTRGTPNTAALESFSREWTVLAGVSHPNIVDFLDSGEFEEDGVRKTFFVMPLLHGQTLDHLMDNVPRRPTTERIVDIVRQACGGLQVAHDHGVIHRDIKPSNIFVMDDDTVKIIDFGVAHLAGRESLTGVKGTLQYMAPEQINLQPCTPASDIYSLGVVCYESLTGRKPFARKTEAETAEAIRSHTPPPICELNPGVSQILSRVVHKGMAKDPWHRFSSAREFSESLQKALKGEMIERFNSSRIQPRIDRAKKAHTEGDYQFASEILRELEAEGNIDPEMSLLRIQVDQAVRQKSIRQLMDSARTRLEEDEFALALQKIQEVLAIDPENPEAAGLRAQIEKQMSQRQMENWFRLVEQHLQNRSFGQARQGLQEILKLNANDARAQELLVEVDRRERETQYQNLYNEARNEREAQLSAYAEARQYITDRNFAKALEMCNEFLKKAPSDPMLQQLKLEAEEQARQEQSAFIAEVSRHVEAEKDLDRRVNILQEAVNRYPEEPHLEQSLRLVRERRDLVNAIVAKARQYENSGQFTEALGQFEILRNIYGQYPGLDFGIEQLKLGRDDQMRKEAKREWVAQLDRHIASGDYAQAQDLARIALAEFPSDRELAGLQRFVEAALKRAAEAEEWLQRGQINILTTGKAQYNQSELILTLDADISVVRRIAEQLIEELKRRSGDSRLQIESIDPGSVIIRLRGTRDGYEVIAHLFKSGQLQTLLGLPVQSVDIHDEPPTDGQHLSANTQPDNRLEVVFSYSHRDEKLRQSLEEHLASLKRNERIRMWHDHRIVAGSEFEFEISSHLAKADLILLLISASFLASDYCFCKEMRVAMDRHESGCARVIPIILRPVEWQETPFRKLLALPRDGRPITAWPDRNEALLDVAKGIRSAVDDIVRSRC